MTPSPRSSNPPWKLLAWMQLCRIPNVFTAVADIWMGYFFVQSSHSHGRELAGLTLGSALLYTAGMVLNDVFDVEQDRRERPGRPLPSGRIRIRQAAAVGWTLLAIGTACGWLVCSSDRDGSPPRSQAGSYAASHAANHNLSTVNRPGLLCTALAVCIVAYDARLKRYWSGPIAMGLCRMLNILLGMSIDTGSVPQGAALAGGWPYAPDALVVAGGVGMYVAGVTWFARTEAHSTPRRSLVGGLATMLAGVVAISLYPLVAGYSVQPHTSVTVWWLLLAVVALPIARRGIRAVAQPEPSRIQGTVKLAILSLILWDASIAWMACGPGVAMAIAALLVPTLLLSRFVYST